MDQNEQELAAVLATLDPTTRTLIAEVDLGDQALEFLRTDLGKHLVGCLQMELDTAQAQLNATASWRRRRIQDLQNRVWRAQFTMTWLRDLILSGKAADGALKEQEHGD